MEISCGVILACTNSCNYEVEEGNAAGGIIEMKNSGFSVDQP